MSCARESGLPIYWADATRRSRAMAENRSTNASNRVPIITTDPYALDILADPLPFHHELREAGPLVRLVRYGVWGMARYAEVASGLRACETFSSSAAVVLSDFRRVRPLPTPA